MSVTVRGAEQTHRVVDVRWIYGEGSDSSNVRLSAVEVRIRKEAAGEA